MREVPKDQHVHGVRASDGHRTKGACNSDDLRSDQHEAAGGWPKPKTSPYYGRSQTQQGKEITRWYPKTHCLSP